MWFGIFLQLFVIIEVLGVLAYGNIASFRLQVSLFGTMSTVFAVKGVDLSIFSGEPSRDAMAAGWLTLAMADILWVLYFSSEPGTPFFRLVDSMQIKDRPKTVTDSEHPHYGPATNKSNPNDADMRSDGSPDETKVGHEKGFEDAEETAHYRNQLERRIVDEPRQVLEERADEVSDRRHHHTSPPSSFNNRRAVYVQEHRQLSTIYDTKTEIGSSTSSSDPDSFFNLYPFKVRAKSDCERFCCASRRRI
jgi:SHO1 osmosensor